MLRNWIGLGVIDHMVIYICFRDSVWSIVSDEQTLELFTTPVVCSQFGLQIFESDSMLEVFQSGSY